MDQDRGSSFLAAASVYSSQAIGAKQPAKSAKAARQATPNRREAARRRDAPTRSRDAGAAAIRRPSPPASPRRHAHRGHAEQRRSGGAAADELGRHVQPQHRQRRRPRRELRMHRLPGAEEHHPQQGSPRHRHRHTSTTSPSTRRSTRSSTPTASATARRATSSTSTPPRNSQEIEKAERVTKHRGLPRSTTRPPPTRSNMIKPVLSADGAGRRSTTPAISGHRAAARRTSAATRTRPTT